MTRRAFYVTGIDGSESRTVLTGPLVHQFRHVLRLTPGQTVELRNGRGGAWAAEIIESGNKAITLRLLARLDSAAEAPVPVTLAMAYSRSDRMDLVVRQAVELGIQRFIAFASERSQYTLAAARERKKQQRWEKITQEALCQCGRTELPEIRLCSSLVRFLSELRERCSSVPETLKILALEEGAAHNLHDLRRAFPMPQEILVAVGCEGGWTGAEVDAFSRSGFHAVHLGPRILRLETAAVTLLSCVQMLWGDLGGERDPDG